MDKVVELLKSMLSDIIEYEITVSNNPDKIKIFERGTGKVKLIEDLNTLEISLLAIISALCNKGGVEIDNDKES